MAPKNLLHYELDHGRHETRSRVEALCRDLLEKAQQDFASAERDADAVLVQARELADDMRGLREEIEQALLRHAGSDEETAVAAAVSDRMEGHS